LNINWKSYAICRMVSFLMILRDSNWVFKVTVLFEGEYLKILYFRDKVSGELIGNYRQAIEW